jgi:hypothetical protein
MMHWYDWVLILVLLVFVYKRAEGYYGGGQQPTYAYGGEIDSYNVPGGRPAEIFMNLSPSEWEEKDVSYAYRSKNNSCNS